MKKTDCVIEEFKLSYPLEMIAPLEDIFFVDIETTGFTAKGSSLYLIGGAYFQNGNFRIIQWFAENYEEESQILVAFSEFCARFSFFIHFNGNHFDLPYLNTKAKLFSIEMPFINKDGLDLYKRIAPYKNFLKLNNCKLKTIEAYLGIKRTDSYGGGELISVYHDYVSNPSLDLLKKLLLHNAEDMKGMLAILPILSYVDLFNHSLKVKKVQANSYSDYNGAKRKELIMHLSFPIALPHRISCYFENCVFIGEQMEGSIIVPIFDEEMKYYYANYKDYYYLPIEDTAIHKSVASCVDSKHKKHATAATCYTRHISSFVQEWELLKEPFFKKEYGSKDTYYELTDELKKDRDFFTIYAQHVLQHLLLQR